MSEARWCLRCRTLLRWDNYEWAPDGALILKGGTLPVHHCPLPNEWPD